MFEICLPTRASNCIVDRSKESQRSGKCMFNNDDKQRHKQSKIQKQLILVHMDRVAFRCGVGAGDPFYRPYGGVGACSCAPVRGSA